jgi:hypothetical protein
MFSIPESFFARSASNERRLFTRDQTDPFSPVQQSILSIKNPSPICQSN